jgi:hypothetical protein
MTTTTTLTTDGLLAAARDKAGLTELGDDWFLEPLQVLLDGLNEEARLSELGLDLTRRRLTALLVDRLRLRDLQARHPQILEPLTRDPPLHEPTTRQRTWTSS